MKKQIIVTIDKQGNVSVEADGYTGDSCEEATRFLETALGVVDEREHKPEYYEQQEQNEWEVNS